jgi:pentatricopeptide repeat protein
MLRDLRACSEWKAPTIVDALLQCGEHPLQTSQIANEVLTALKQPDTILKVTAALLDDSATSPSIYTLNIAMAQLRKCRTTTAQGKRTGAAAHAALRFLKQMRKAGVTPTARTYVSAIAVCADGKRAHEGFHVFEAMKSAGVEPEVHVYSAMVALCYKCNEFDKAMALYREMRDAGVAPNVVTYNNLITACARAKRLDDACDVHAAMVLNYPY